MIFPFKKKPFSKLKNFFLGLDLKKARSLILSVNQTEEGERSETRLVEIWETGKKKTNWNLVLQENQEVGPKDIDFGPEKGPLYVECIHHGKTLVKNEFIDELEEISFNFNLFSDELIQYFIDYYVPFINDLPDSVRITPEEVRGYEWVKGTLEVAKNAINHCMNDPDLLFQSLLIFGLNPIDLEEGQGPKELPFLRIKVFHLDFLLHFRDDKKVHLKVFNDNQNPSSSAKEELIKDTPDFQFQFLGKKQDLFNEFIKLLSVIGKALKLGRVPGDGPGTTFDTSSSRQ